MSYECESMLHLPTEGLLLHLPTWGLVQSDSASILDC